ncbi:cytochrome c, partial [Flavihumibacter sediminis]|nr:cytochrome c [Flavihumibacter sediminis]
KNKIISWIDNGAPQGNPSKAAEKSKEALILGTVYHRKPDLTLKMEENFTVIGGNIEQFVIFKLPFELSDSFNIEAIEFVANNKKLVHHVNYAIHAVPDERIDIQRTDKMINLTFDDRRKFDQYQPYRKSITYYGGW